MCEITYTKDPEKRLIQFVSKGHADVKGGPVCGAVSVLLQQAIVAAAMWQDGVVTKKEESFFPGDILASYTVGEGYFEYLELQMDTIYSSLAILANSYPDKIKINSELPSTQENPATDKL